MAPWAPWPIPPCPYPSNLWVRPQQAYTTASNTTNIEAAMHTLSITPPDANWYIDTGATSDIHTR